METMTINLAEIITDWRCQPRSGIESWLVQEYVDAIRKGATLPPLSAIKTTKGYCLYDGFHRLEAYRFAGKKQVDVEYEEGDVWDARERSCGVNATHGKRRTPGDTKRAVERCLEVMRHRGERWSNVEIAEKCALSPQHVGRLVKDLSITLAIDSDIPITVTRGGTTYPMDATKIGRWRAPNIEAPADDDEENAGQTERMAIDTIERRIQGPDGDEVLRTAIVAQYATVVSTVMGKLVPLDPDVTARAIGDRQGTDRFIEQTRDWLDRFEAARKRTGTIHELKRKDTAS